MSTNLYPHIFFIRYIYFSAKLFGAQQKIEEYYALKFKIF